MGAQPAEYVRITVTCSECQAKQDVHVRPRISSSQVGWQSVRCLTCDAPFRVLVPDEIIDGPFPHLQP